MQIEQIDRDAAADLIEAQYAREGVAPGRLQTPAETRRGERDHCIEVQHMARRRLAALSARPADSDMVERVAIAIAKVWYGPDFDPFAAPEYYDMAEQCARAAIAALGD